MGPSLDSTGQFETPMVNQKIAGNGRRIEPLQHQATPADPLGLPGVIGMSRSMRDVSLRIQQVTTTHTTVLIRGEPGTGKEVAAAAVHALSLRAKRPLVKVRCAAMSDDLLENELFGHEEGGLAGSLSPRAGRIEEAEGGTLLLDEIGNFAPAIQVRLLRFLQEGEFERIDGSKTICSDVRVIATTSRDLEAAVEAGQFRQDLYYKINVFPILLPPLRDRKDDIPALAAHFMAKYATEMGKEVHSISDTAVNRMLAYSWPGNVRELENCVEYAVLLSRDEVIQDQHLPPMLRTSCRSDAAGCGSLRQRVAALEKDMIVDALASTRGNVNSAARRLDITPRMVRYKMKKLGIDPHRFADQNGS